MTCTINRWRVKIDWKRVYNVRDPLRMRDHGKRVGREKNEKTVVVCMVLKTTVT